MRGLIYALQGLQLKAERTGAVRQLCAQEALEFRDGHRGFAEAAEQKGADLHGFAGQAQMCL